MKIHERVIAGVDEAGRGPWAGPVVAAAVALHALYFSEKIDDSKRLTASQRERAFNEIIQKASVGVGVVSAALIDRINILNATRAAMEQALYNLSRKTRFAFIDGTVSLNLSFPYCSVKKGDQRLLSVSCASIIAKVTRDRMMQIYDTFYPGYGFASHKGYGTKEHLDALRRLGPCPLHRKSFKPLQCVV